jgi:hypothetical protein
LLYGVCHGCVDVKTLPQFRVDIGGFCIQRLIAKQHGPIKQLKDNEQQNLMDEVDG